MWLFTWEEEKFQYVIGLHLFYNCRQSQCKSSLQNLLFYKISTELKLRAIYFGQIPERSSRCVNSVLITFSDS
jgi:hypothetical protein